MAKAKKLPSGNWHALVYSHTDADKKRHYESFTAGTKNEAEFLAAQFKMEKKRKQQTGLTLGEAMDRYIASKDAVLSPATIAGYKRIRRRAVQGLVNKPLDSITQNDIQLAVNQEARLKSPKSVRNIHGLLSATMTSFRPDFKLATTLPQKTASKLYIPSNDDIKRLLSSINNTELEIAVLLAAFGSLRRSEISPLTGADIDGNTVYINKAMVQNEAGDWVLKSPKTYSSYRSVELPAPVTAKLSKTDGRLIELNPGQITKRFSNALRSNGLPHFRFHDLRHYQASILHALGVPDKYIMERGGWKTRSTLDNVYKHTMDAKTKEVTDIANTFFSSLMQDNMQNEKNK